MKQYFLMPFCILFISLFSSCTPNQQNPEETKRVLAPPVDYEKALHHYDLARKAIQEDSLLKAAGHYMLAGENGFEPQNAYMSSISYFMQHDKSAEALEAARLLVEKGCRDLRPFQTDENLSKITSLPDWPEIKAGIEQNKKDYEVSHSNLSNIIVETSDIDRFWKAFDKAAEVSDPELKKKIYLDEYFTPASIGLQDFTFLKMRKGIGDFVDFVESHRPYYEGIREPTYKALEGLSKLPEYFEKVRSFIPEATFSDYYFVIGRHTSFGTVSLNGSLIGLENVIDENTPVETLSKNRQAVVAPATFLPFVLIHELIHTYQNTSNPTLLGATIIEGGADLITELIMGPPVPLPPYRIYGEQNEAAVFSHFEKVMDGTSQKGWIGNISDYEAPEEGWVRDLSYFVGYKIAKAYYEQAEDKEQAIQDLLDNKDPNAILKASGYLGSQ